MPKLDRRLREYIYNGGRVFYGASGYDATGYPTFTYYEPDGSEIPERDALGRTATAVRIHENINRLHPLSGRLR